MIFIIIILGFGLRLISLNQSLWIDEATSALTTQMNLFDFFHKFLPGDFHPPLYYLTLRAWIQVFGISEIALRSLSVVFGTATIYLVYLIGKKVVNEKVGFFAGLMLATSGLHIYYSQEARMYSMNTFLVSLAVLFFIKVFHKESRAVDWVWFSIVLALAGLIDYLPLLIILSFWLIAIFSRKHISWWKKFIMSHIMLGVSALAWLPIFIQQLNSGINVTNASPAWAAVLGQFSLKEILLVPVKFEIGRITILDKNMYIFVVGIITFIFLYLFVAAIKEFRKMKIIWLWLFIPILVSLIISFKIPVLNYFRFLFVLPAFYLIIASGIKHKIFLIILIIINIVSSFMYLTNIKFQREDWRSAVGFVQENREEDSVVVFPTLSQQEAFRYYSPSEKILIPHEVNKENEVWLVRYAQVISDPQDLGREKIESYGYTKTQEYDFNGVTIWKYNK